MVRRIASWFMGSVCRGVEKESGYLTEPGRPKVTLARDKFATWLGAQGVTFLRPFALPSELAPKMGEKMAKLAPFLT